MRTVYFLVGAILVLLVFQFYLRYQYVHTVGARITRIDRVTGQSCELPCEEYVGTNAQRSVDAVRAVLPTATPRPSREEMIDRAVEASTPSRKDMIDRAVEAVCGTPRPGETREDYGRRPCVPQGAPAKVTQAVPCSDLPNNVRGRFAQCMPTLPPGAVAVPTAVVPK